MKEQDNTWCPLWCYLYVHQLIRTDASLRDYVAPILAKAKESGDYDRAYKMFMMLEADPPDALLERLKLEFEGVLSKIERNPAKRAELLSPVLDNVNILVALQNDGSIRMLRSLLNSGISLLSFDILRRFDRIDRKNRMRFVPDLERLAQRRHPFQSQEGMLAWEACNALQKADPEGARRFLTSLLDSPHEDVMKSAAYSLARFSPPAVTLEEMRDHLRTTRNPKALRGVLADIEARFMGREYQSKTIAAGMEKPIYSYMAPNTRRYIPLLFRARDKRVLSAFETFLLYGEDIYTREADANRYNLYDTYFRNLWAYTEGLREAYPDAPSHERWFWLCATKEEKERARKRIHKFVWNLYD
jgi:hypothetical protein